MKCTACGSPFFTLGKNNGVEILKCSKCGFGITKDFVKPDYAHYHRDQIYEQNENQFKNIFKRIVKDVLRYKKSGKALDVGSSTGILLSLFEQRGWEVQGIEPSEEASSNADRLGIPTINNSFEKANLNLDSFDVIVVDHVLEHMMDLDEVLGKVSRILKNDGVLVVNVPNFGSLSARLNGVSWEYVLPQEHLWHFTYQSLETLLKKHGFKVLSWEARSGIWDYNNPLLELWQSFTSFKKRFFRNLFTAIPSWIITRLKLGTGLSVIAQKR